MPHPNSTLALWQKMSAVPGGKWAFSRLVCWKAPYFASISPHFAELRPGYGEVFLKKHRAVTNHIGTVHAIAMCNMAELVGGSMTEVTTPGTHRWIPKRMSVEYLKKAETDLRAVVELTPLPEFGGEGFELPITVNVTDTAGQLVFRALITMWVSPKKA